MQSHHLTLNSIHKGLFVGECSQPELCITPFPLRSATVFASSGLVLTMDTQSLKANVFVFLFFQLELLIGLLTENNYKMWKKIINNTNQFFFLAFLHCGVSWKSILYCIGFFAAIAQVATGGIGDRAKVAVQHPVFVKHVSFKQLCSTTLLHNFYVHVLSS